MQITDSALQLLITFLPLLIGAGIGGGLGYLYARTLRNMIQRQPSVRCKLFLFPWRSMLVMLPFLSFFTPILFGLGLTSGLVVVGIFVVLFTLPFTTSTLLNTWFPLPLRIRLLALARIISVAAISVATATGLISGFSAGFQMFRAMQLLDYGTFFNLFFTVFVIELLVDVLFGVVQFIFYRVGESPGSSG